MNKVAEPARNIEKPISQSLEDRSRLHDLVWMAQAGDKQAFTELVQRTQRKVRKIAYSIVGKEHVEDASQEIYLVVLKKLAHLQKPEAFISWLSRIALHVCYDIKKKQRIEYELPENSSLPDHAQGVSNKLSIHKALSQLHQRDRDVLILREILELSYEEMSPTLRVPIGTVRSRLNKARKVLAERLKS